MPGPSPRPALQLVREGNPGNHPKERLEPGLRLEAIAPAEPDWRDWWPAVRPRTVNQLKRLHTLKSLQGQLAHIEDDRKRDRLARLRQEWLVSRDREQDKRAQKVNQRARDVARLTWRRIVPVLERQGLLTDVDADVLRDYCICVARLDECERNVSELGIWQRGERGAMKNPATTVANQLRQSLKFYVGQLGLTPVARDALSPGEVDDGAEEGFD